MVTIADRTRKYLDTNFNITSCLLRNIISLRALSRLICRSLDLNEDKNLYAVMSAVRRYKKENKLDEAKKTRKIFSNMGVKTKDNVADIYLSRNKSNQSKLSKFNDLISFEKGDTLRIIQAEQGIRVIVDEKNLEHFHNIFSEKEMLETQKGLAEVNVQFSLEAARTHGILAMVCSSINAGNVNILEIMSSAPELILIIEGKDVTKVINVLNGLKNLY